MLAPLRNRSALGSALLRGALPARGLASRRFLGGGLPPGRLARGRLLRCHSRPPFLPAFLPASGGYARALFTLAPRAPRPGSRRHPFEASPFPFAHATPHAVPLIATERVVEAFDPNGTLSADPFGLPRRSPLLGEEDLRVVVPAPGPFLPWDVVMHAALPPNHIRVILREEPPLWQEGSSGGSLPRPSSHGIVAKRADECKAFDAKSLKSVTLTDLVRPVDGLGRRKPFAPRSGRTWYPGPRGSVRSIGSRRRTRRAPCGSPTRSRPSD